MSNMSYCRFENTVKDLRDCLRALREKDIAGMSRHEYEAMQEFIELFRDCAEDVSTEEFPEIPFAEYMQTHYYEGEENY